VRDDVIDQMRRRLRHPAGTTRGTKAAPLARERHQLVVPAVAAAQPQEPERHRATDRLVVWWQLAREFSRGLCLGASRAAPSSAIDLNAYFCAPKTAGLSDQTNIEVLTADRAASLEHLDSQALNGSNQMQLGVCGNDLEGQVLLSAVFDNLGKGACGAAIQNLELMLGVNPTASQRHTSATNPDRTAPVTSQSTA
jgi:hypothetical protein